MCYNLNKNVSLFPSSKFMLGITAVRNGAIECGAGVRVSECVGEIEMIDTPYRKNSVYTDY